MTSQCTYIMINDKLNITIPVVISRSQNVRLSILGRSKGRDSVYRSIKAVSSEYVVSICTQELGGDKMVGIAILPFHFLFFDE